MRCIFTNIVQNIRVCYFVSTYFQYILLIAWEPPDNKRFMQQHRARGATLKVGGLTNNNNNNIIHLYSA